MKVPQVKTLNCPNCGGTVNLRNHGQTVNAVCIQCQTVLDAKTPTLTILQKFEEAQRRTPRIPLGQRGKIGDVEHEVIGFQARAIVVDGEQYEWSEYLLVNPYHGYRYLTEYAGHWNSVTTLRHLPESARAFGNKKAMQTGGRVFKHFQSAEASTIFVMGEFPWQVRVGEAVQVDDYVAPPFMLSSETTANEVTWSQGEYLDGAAVWKLFKLPGTPPAASGVFSNQPSPHTGRVLSVWKLFVLLLFATAGVAILLALASRKEEAFRGTYHFDTAYRGEASFVTPVFELRGRDSNVRVTVTSDLMNDWAFLAFALINDETGRAYDFGREISYYRGRDSDGDWAEGGPSSSSTIPAVPSGRYYLRIEPEMDDAPGQRHFMRYDLIVTRGGVGFGYFWIAGLLLLLPPLFITYRAFRFENERWKESDYGPLLQSSGNEE